MTARNTYAEGVFTAVGNLTKVEVGDFDYSFATVSGSEAAGLSGHGIIFEGSTDSVDGTDGKWQPIALQSLGGPSISPSTSISSLSADPTALYIAPVAGLRWIRVRCTTHTAGSIKWTIALSKAPSALIPPSTTAVSSLPALAAGTNAIGDVGVQYRTSTTGAALLRKIVAAASTNATNVKSSAGRLLGWSLSNTTASWVYVKLHNSASAPTAGASVFMVIGVPPNGVASGNLEGGIAFTTGIGFTLVTGAADADATAVAANSVVGSLFYV